MVNIRLCLLGAALAISSTLAVDITVRSTGGNATSGHQYGFLHEDINYSGDGGIYAELVRNRAFQGAGRFAASLRWWRAVNGAQLSLQQQVNPPLSTAVRNAVRVTPPASGSGRVGLANDGYWGMNVKRQKYTGSFWVKGAYTGTFTASLQSALTKDTFGSVDIVSKSVADKWVEHEVELVPTRDAPNSNNTFAITFDAAAVKGRSLDFTLISLFPPTYKGRKNGLRVDIAEALEQLHPTFFRFPGGNMLEGDTPAEFWDWKKTLGPLKDRPAFPNTWGYQVTYGLGLMEYLYWAEDMGMEIVIGVWAGLALNGAITPRAQMKPVIDDALAQIEFIRGPATSTWGKRRAELGHPEPFRLRFVEVGNEDWLGGGAAGWQSYKDYRFPMFLEAINKAYPDITVIASGATHDGYRVPRGTGQFAAMGDYHPYRKPNELVSEFNKFDNDPIPHIIGEVAATHVNGGSGWSGGLTKFPWWIGTVGEAVSMIGYERNADRIRGTFYAPVLRNMDSWNWAVTLLQYAADPKLTTRSTSWYLWELFAAHPITHTLPATGAPFNPLFYGAGTHSATGSRVWKGAVYNTTNHAAVSVGVRFEGLDAGARAQLRTLTTAGAGDAMRWNDPHTGVNVVKSSRAVLTAGQGGFFRFEMPELSVAVLDTDLENPRPRATKRNE